MIHWCADETAMVVSGAGTLVVAWHWVKHRMRAWLSHLRSK